MAASFDTKHALITGGSGGLGIAAARTLMEGGARITLLARGSENLTTAAALLVNEVDGEVLTVTADVARPEQMGRAVDHAVGSFGPVDILIHAAAERETVALGGLDPDRARRMLTAGPLGALIAAQQVLPGMLEAGEGRIIALTGVAALKGRAYEAGYAMAAHGIAGFVKAAAAELSDTGITVNALVSGVVATQALMAEIDEIVTRTRRPKDQVLADYAKANPHRKLIEAAEIGKTIAWLCSPAAASVTGQLIAATGGENP